MSSLTGPSGISNQKSPGQKNLWNTLYGAAESSGKGLQEGYARLNRLAAGDEGEFSKLEAPAFRDLQRAGSQTASQFSGFGSGARNSSGFQNAIAGEAGDLAERLQSQRMGIQDKALFHLKNLSRELFKDNLFDEDDEEFRPKKKNKWKDFGMRLGREGLPIAGEAVGNYFGGSFGGSLGRLVGTQASESFFG